MHGKKVHIGNKWWKIMTIYSKEMKTRRRRVEDAMKKNREVYSCEGNKGKRNMKLGGELKIRNENERGDLGRSKKIDGRF
jgi:hypothetical protein